MCLIVCLCVFVVVCFTRVVSLAGRFGGLSVRSTATFLIRCSVVLICRNGAWLQALRGFPRGGTFFDSFRFEFGMLDRRIGPASDPRDDSFSHGAMVRRTCQMCVAFVVLRRVLAQNPCPCAFGDVQFLASRNEACWCERQFRSGC